MKIFTLRPDTFTLNFQCYSLIGMRHSIRRLFSFLFGIIIVSHWNACLW